MAQSRLYTIIGDGNVRRNMTSLNMGSRESMKSAQIISCPALPGLSSAFSEIRKESTVFIFAGVTQLLLSTPECSTVYATIDPVLSALKESIVRCLIS